MPPRCISLCLIDTLKTAARLGEHRQMAMAVVNGTRGTLAPELTARVVCRCPSSRLVVRLHSLQPSLQCRRRWAIVVRAASEGGPARRGDSQQLGKGGLDPALERAVPRDQRPVNELKALRQTALYSWVSDSAKNAASSLWQLLHAACWPLGMDA